MRVTNTRLATAVHKTTTSRTTGTRDQWSSLGFWGRIPSVRVTPEGEEFRAAAPNAAGRWRQSSGHGVRGSRDGNRDRDRDRNRDRSAGTARNPPKASSRQEFTPHLQGKPHHLPPPIPLHQREKSAPAAHPPPPATCLVGFGVK